MEQKNQQWREQDRERRMQSSSGDTLGKVESTATSDQNVEVETKPQLQDSTQTAQTLEPKPPVQQQQAMVQPRLVSSSAPSAEIQEDPDVAPQRSLSLGGADDAEGAQRDTSESSRTEEHSEMTVDPTDDSNVEEEEQAPGNGEESVIGPLREDTEVPPPMSHLLNDNKEEYRFRRGYNRTVSTGNVSTQNTSSSTFNISSSSVGSSAGGADVAGDPVSDTAEAGKVEGDVDVLAKADNSIRYFLLLRSVAFGCV